jgi:hypothetical protein
MSDTSWATLASAAVIITGQIIQYLKSRQIETKVNGHASAMQAEAVSQTAEIKTLNAAVATALASKQSPPES